MTEAQAPRRPQRPHLRRRQRVRALSEAARALSGEGIFDPAAACLALLPTLAPPERPLIAGVYEALLAPADRRGVFYTPPPLATALAALALPALPPGPVIDPAAGAGALLLAAARRLKALYAAAAHPQPKAAAAAMLLGLDQDPGALRVAQALLAAEGYPLAPGQLQARDALAGPWPGAPFGAVITNPPFVNIVRLPAPRRAALQARFQTFRNKCDLYGLFTEAALAQLAPGGRAALILSDTFLGASSFAPLRRLLFCGEGPEPTHCEALYRLDPRAFDAAVRAVALIQAAGRAPPGAQIQVGALSLDGALRREGSLGAARLAARAPASAALLTRPEALPLIEALEARSTPLGALVELSLGVKTGDDARFLSLQPRRPSDRQALRGRDVQPYRCAPSAYLDYRPAELRAVHGARPRDPAAFARRPRLVVRETSGPRLIAALDPAACVPLDTLHTLWRRPEAGPWSLHALLAALNSAPISAWYGAHHPGSHVKLAELRALPLPTLPRPEAARVPEAQSAAIAWIYDPACPLAPPAPCFGLAVAAPLLDLLGRLRCAPLPAPLAARADQLIDAVIARAAGLEGLA